MSRRWLTPFAVILALTNCGRETRGPDAAQTAAGIEQASGHSREVCGPDRPSDLATKAETPAQLLDSLFVAFEADDPEKRIALTRYILELYEAGGEELFDLGAGGRIRHMPDLDNAAAVLSARPGSDTSTARRQAYIVVFALEHTPEYMRRYRAARQRVLVAADLRKVMVTGLFDLRSPADTALLVNSIASEYVLGGIRRFRAGDIVRCKTAVATTPEAFVAYLATYYTPQFVQTVQLLKSDPALQELTELEYRQYLENRRHATGDAGRIRR